MNTVRKQCNKFRCCGCFYSCGYFTSAYKLVQKITHTTLVPKIAHTRSVSHYEESLLAEVDQGGSQQAIFL